MTLQKLIKTNNWLSVEMTFSILYPDQVESIETYKKVFLQLQEMTPIPSKNQIVLEQCYDMETSEKTYVDVSGVKGNTKNSEQTDSLALEFMPWREWLGMSIKENSLKEFNELEIISHCLFEMTFIGFDEGEIQEQFLSIKNSIDDYKILNEEEKKIHNKTLEDFLKELDEE